LLASAALISRVTAAEEEPARAGESALVSVWYRGAEGCPDGTVFIRQVASRTGRARLAEVGDRVDFVVTLGVKDSVSVGRLERQTARGTVAIRELSGDDCEQVADALALTLALTLEPDESPVAEALPPSAADVPASPAEAPASAPRPRPPPPILAPASQPVVRRDAPARKTLAADGAQLSWSGSAAALVLGGVSTTAMPAFGFFVQAALSRRGVLRPAIRVGVVRGSAESGGLDVSLLAGRVEVCPLEWQRAAVALRPCLSVHAGSLRAEFGAARSADVAPWLDAGPLLRLEYRPILPIQLELQTGGFFPITRYSFELQGMETEEIHRIARLGWQVGAGVGILVP
jgi:hypothetical protein